MAQRVSYLDRLSVTDTAMPAVVEEPAQATGIDTSAQSMPPPPARRTGPKPPAGELGLPDKHHRTCSIIA